MTSSITKQFIIDYLAELSNSERVDILSKVSDKINSCNVITESKIEEHNESKIEEPESKIEEPESKIEEPESKAEPEEQQQPDSFCCCCYEECEYITRCNHTLCPNCYSGIETMTNGNICPICRSSIEEGVSNNGFIHEITDYEIMMLEAKQRFKIILDATFKFLKLFYREYRINIIPDGFEIFYSVNGDKLVFDILEGFETPYKFNKYFDFIRKFYRNYVKSCNTDYTWVSDDDKNTWNIKFLKMNIKYINLDNGNRMDILQCLPVNPAISTDDYYDKKDYLDNYNLDMINKILIDDQIASRNVFY